MVVFSVSGFQLTVFSLGPETLRFPRLPPVFPVFLPSGSELRLKETSLFCVITSNQRAPLSVGQGVWESPASRSPLGSVWKTAARLFKNTVSPLKNLWRLCQHSQTGQESPKPVTLPHWSCSFSIKD